MTFIKESASEAGSDDYRELQKTAEAGFSPDQAGAVIQEQIAEVAKILHDFASGRVGYDKVRGKIDDLSVLVERIKEQPWHRKRLEQEMNGE
ncbi:MAG: hypothetical protein V1856_01590 [Candidatus Liptonbacteria bacterium]